MLHHRSSPELRYNKLLAMASYTSIWAATTQEQPGLQTEQLATLNGRIAKLEFELKAKSDACEAAYVWAKGTSNKMNQFADRAELLRRQSSASRRKSKSSRQKPGALKRIPMRIPIVCPVLQENGRR